MAHLSTLSRLVIGHGAGSSFNILQPTGLRRPYTLVTMDALWWEAAAELGIPRYFFKNKRKMIQFCLGHHLIVVTTKDGTDKSRAIDAAFVAIGAVPFRLTVN